MSFVSTPSLFGDEESGDGDSVAVASPETATGEAPSAEGDSTSSPAELNDFKIDNLWIMLSGCLVFIMHLGFASLEAGLTRQKNTINILFKNTMIISIGLLTYGLIGFNVMYPGFSDDSLGILSLEAIPNFVTLQEGAPDLTPAYGDYTWYTDFFFQAMFAATCATIVSGSVAGRVKLSSFLIFATCLLLFCYPVTGAWHWGGGWLARLGFYDFAGSTLVHSVGGWAALVMAWLLGPRLGKYNADGSPNAIPGSNMPLVAVGVFLLWFGWFGFNGGSVLSADPALTSLVLVTTSMAAAAGGLAAGLVSWTQGKPDVTMALNGILAGLVGVTASADSVTIQGAVMIGAIAGVIVYFSVVIVDKKIDDPVGAVSVHLVCGIWGTIAVAIFGGGDFVAQLIGIGAIGAYTVIFTLIVGSILKATLGIRVSASEEEVGLDVSEHGMSAYN
ncbi:MAG: ammonium transporter [Planctomycetaceae bacterium]|nr:ammonium transporter [Planctomycetaceae bacterium]